MGVPVGYKHTPEALEKITAARRARGGRPRSVEARAKISAYQRGRPKSAAQRAKLSAAMKGNMNGSKTLYCGTWPEQVMAAILEHAEVEFEAQKWIGRACVDFYIPATKTAIEVDGEHWHPNGPDQARDAALRSKGVAVYHITDTQLIEEGWI